MFFIGTWAGLHTWHTELKLFVWAVKTKSCYWGLCWNLRNVGLQSLWQTQTLKNLTSLSSNEGNLASPNSGFLTINSNSVLARLRQILFQNIRDWILFTGSRETLWQNLVWRVSKFEYCKCTEGSSVRVMCDKNTAVAHSDNWELCPK